MKVPQFMCFGTTRCGTTFLQVHLRAHPRIWLPPQKEIHYFNAQRDSGIWNRKHGRHVRETLPNLRKAIRGKRGNAAELAWQLRYLIGRRSDDWFLSLYDPPPGLITGHIEPTYTTLPTERIRLVSRLLPGVKLIYMMRDPIDRAWSSVTSSVAKAKNRPMSDVSEDEIFEKLARSAIEKSRHIDHIKRWEAVFPKQRFFFGFFEDIETDPAGFLARVGDFLEIGPPPVSEGDDLERPINDTRRFKAAIPPNIEKFLAERLIEPTRELHERFGGYTSAWYDRMWRLVAAPPRTPAAWPRAAAPER
jgi:hypothetical protein